MQLRIIKAWGLSNPGDIVDAPHGSAIELIRRGIAAEVVETQHEEVTSDPPAVAEANKAIKAKNVKRKGITNGQ